MQYTYILLGVYSLIILGIFAFYVIFSLHIKKFRNYSKYLTPVFRIVIALTIIIAIFGAYKILTGSAKNPRPSYDYNTTPRIDY